LTEEGHRLAHLVNKWLENGRKPASLAKNNLSFKAGCRFFAPTRDIFPPRADARIFAIGPRISKRGE
jgi:hypothetical protein